MLTVPNADPNITNNPIAQKYTKNAMKIAQDLNDAKKDFKDAGTLAGKDLDLDKAMFDMCVNQAKNALEEVGILKPPAVNSMM